MSGPVPKHSTERRRRNKSSKPDKVQVEPRSRGPALPAGETHCQLARDWYNALRRSGQAIFFEPSDWAQARLVVAAIDSFMAAPTGRRSSTMFTAIMASSTSLLVTEGDRRRLRVELEHAGDKPAAPQTAADVYKGLTAVK